MKTLRFTLLALACAVSARADLTISQQIKQEGAPGGKDMDMTVTMKVKGDKVRMDGVPGMANIVDMNTGDMTTLAHQQKMVMTIPGTELKKMQAAQAGVVPKIDPPKATGKKETISGFACEEYETTLNGAKVQLWLTKDLPAVESVMKRFANFSGQTDPFQEILKGEKISGFPIRTVMEMPGAGKLTMQVVKIAEDAIPDGEFAVPADYKAMPMPALPGTP
jgi:hypothetical protein